MTRQLPRDMAFNQEDETFYDPEHTLTTSRKDLKQHKVRLYTAHRSPIPDRQEVACHMKHKADKRSKADTNGNISALYNDHEQSDSKHKSQASGRPINNDVPGSKKRINMLYMDQDKHAINGQDSSAFRGLSKNAYARDRSNNRLEHQKNISTSQVTSPKQNSPKFIQNSRGNSVDVHNSSIGGSGISSATVQRMSNGSVESLACNREKLPPDKLSNDVQKSSRHSSRHASLSSADSKSEHWKNSGTYIKNGQSLSEYPENCDIVNNRSEKVVSIHSSRDSPSTCTSSDKPKRPLPVPFRDSQYDKFHSSKTNTSPRISKVKESSGSGALPSEYNHTNTNHQHRNPSNSKDSKQFSSSYGKAGSLVSQDSSHVTKVQHSSPNLDVSSQISSKSAAKTEGDRIKYVSLLPNLTGELEHTRLSGIALCEQLFGIILCHYNSKSSSNSNGSDMDRILKDRKVIVRDIVHGSVAEKCSQIHRGDMLISVNDIEVSWLNLQDILGAIGSKVVKLTFQEPVLVGPGKLTLLQHNVPMKDSLIYQLTKQHASDIIPPQEKHHYSAMYLSLDSISSDDQELPKDVIYQFPAESSKLTELKGLYLTLNSILKDITNDDVKESAICYKNSVINAVYYKEEKDVLVLCFPDDRVPACACRIIMKDLANLVKVLYGSLNSAFRESGNREHLNELFTLTFYRLFEAYDSVAIKNSHEIAMKLFLESLTGIRWLNLTEENKLICDEILSDFEAAEFDNPQLSYQRRKFTVIASSLFYKDYLMTSHLPAEYLKSIHLFLKYHCILDIASRQPSEDIVIWREVYLTNTAVTSQPPLMGYTVSTGRTFLLLVSMNNFLVATILEAGVYSSSLDDDIYPEQMIIDELKLSMKQLESEDVAMADCCEQRLLSENDGPSLISADMVMINLKTRKEDLIPGASPSKKPQTPAKSSTPLKTPSSDYKKKSTPQIDRSPAMFDDDSLDKISGSSETSTPVMRRHGSKTSNGSNDSGGSGGSSGNNRAKISRSLFDMSNIGKSLFGLHEEEANTGSSQTKIISGAENCLFHYISFETFQGVYIGPTSHEVDLVNGAIHKDLLCNFHRCCLHLHDDFLHSALIQDKEKNLKFGESTFQLFDEQGVLFQVSTHTFSPEHRKSHPPVLKYWVLGRYFPPPCSREFYICVHESVHQDLVEAAFSFHFGY